MVSFEKLSTIANRIDAAVIKGTHRTSDFRADLIDAIKQSSHASAPDKDTLMLIVRTIQVEMNRRLLNSVLDSSMEIQLLSTTLPLNYNMGGRSDAFGLKMDNEPKPPEGKTQSGQKIYDSMIIEAARENGVDEHLIQSVIKAESGFDPAARSPKGAMGLMQLMPETAKELGVKDPYDPRQNIMGGARYLKRLLDRYDGHVDSALAAYNWGMGNLERSPNRLPDETVTYISRVNRFYQEAKS